MAYALVNILIVSFALTVHGSKVPLIVGGNTAAEGKYPYQVSLRYLDQHYCGGSIINNRYILTAAHCLIKEYLVRTKVFVGTNYLDKGGDSYSVENAIVHPNYKTSDNSNDIGLIRVTKEIEFKSTVQPIPLSLNRAREGTSAVATGWGRYNPGISALPNALQEVHLRVISRSSCMNVMGYIPETQLCTFTMRGEGVCNGDSGGPLTANGIQIGIVSYGIPCAIGYPDMYTSVNSYQDFIRQNSNVDVKWQKNHASSTTVSFLIITTITVALCSIF